MGEYTKTERNVLQGHLVNALIDMGNIAADKDDILIYMPDHFQQQFMGRMGRAQKYDSRLGDVTVVKFNGYHVLQGYENAIVVSVKDGSLHDIEPIRIELNEGCDHQFVEAYNVEFKKGQTLEIADVCVKCQLVKQRIK